MSIGVVQITAADYDTDNYEILAGTMDMNWGFTVTPVKVLVTIEGRGSIVTVTIANSEDTAKHFEIRQEEAWKVTEGLQPWDGKMSLRFPTSVTVAANSDFAFDVVIDKGRATYGQEAWLMIAQVSDNVIQHEVAVRLLIELN